MIAVVVSWIEFQGQSNNIVHGCSVSCKKGTTFENITKLWISLCCQYTRE